MFVWDESKRIKVINEHKVDFALVTDVFDDPFGVYREDTEHSGDEEIRYTVNRRDCRIRVDFCGVYLCGQ